MRSILRAIRRYASSRPETGGSAMTATQQLAINGGVPVRSRPFPSWPVWDQREVQAVREVVESGNWGGFPSPNVRASEFAEEFASYHTARYGICTSNGTTALEVALKAAGVKPGDEVIVPPLTFMATAAAALYIGAVPVFADITPDTWCLDPDEIEKAITRKTRAVVPVHLGSRMADMDLIMEIARSHGLKVIEDCAHMHGGFWRGKGAGSIGDLGCFSFQSSKLMTAGEGGIILTSDEELEDRSQSYVNCGRIRPGDRYVGPQEALGWNYRMTELQAAVLLVQFERLKEQVAARDENMQYLTARLEGVEGVSTLRQDDRMTTRSGYGYVVKYTPEAFGGTPRNTFVAALNAEGIPCQGAFYEPVYKSPLFGWRDAPVPVDYSETFCPVAERAAYQEMVWLPHQLFLGTRQDVDDIAAAIEKVAGAYRTHSG
jgi:dTDP-4-amino-4,6-dideoxygalactose transaminase